MVSTGNELRQPGDELDGNSIYDSNRPMILALARKARAITIDGVDIREFQLQSLRRHFGFVLQDTALFHGSIAENISYGLPTATAREIAEAAELADAHEFIRNMPQGYRTLVGDRGMTLSEGSGSAV